MSATVAVTPTLKPAPPPPVVATAVPPKERDRGEFQFLNPHQIVPSLTNPRKTRNAEADAELLQSVSLYGVTQPVQVFATVFKLGHAQALKERSMATHMKPGDDCYELIAGERRWEASLRAGRPTIRAMIESLLDDAEKMEHQVIENDQREDLDPIDRAVGYRNLVQKHKDEHPGTKENEYIEYLGRKLGKKPRTVYQIMKLADATAETQAAMRKSVISISHAYELCRLTAVNQKNVLKWIDEQQEWGDRVSVHELKEHIQREIYLSLDHAPFDIKSTSLLAGAGACIGCPKNTTVDPHLAPDRKKPTCTDPVCYHQKADNHVHLVQISLEKGGQKVVRIAVDRNRRPTKNNQFIPSDDWKKADSKKCANSVMGVVIDGNEDNGFKPGEKFLVCTKKSCTVHWLTATGSSSGAWDPPPRHKVDGGDLRKKIRANKLNEATRVACSAAIRSSVKELKHEDLQAAAERMFDGLHHQLARGMCTAMGWKISGSWGASADAKKRIAAMKQAELAAFIVLMVNAETVLPGLPDYISDVDSRKLSAFDNRHKLNLEKVSEKATAELKAKFADIDKRRKEKEKKAKLQTSAKAGQKGKDAAA